MTQSRYWKGLTTGPSILDQSHPSPSIQLFLAGLGLKSGRACPSGIRVSLIHAEQRVDKVRQLSCEWRSRGSLRELTETCASTEGVV